MSGRSLFPLSITLASMLSKEFDGKLRISYSGGADLHSIKALAQAGIWPITRVDIPPSGWISPHC